MSHFAVIVIGEDVEKVLEPFDERKRVEERREKVDEKTCDLYRRMLSEKTGDLPATIRSEDIPRLMKEHYGEDNLEADGPTLYELTTKNPNGKWDWWIVGGRFSNWFHVKPEYQQSPDAPQPPDVDYGASQPPAIGELDSSRADRADRLRVKAVDWEGMLSKGGAAGADLYDRVHAALAGREIPDPPPSSITARDAGEDVEAARQRFREWWSTPAVTAAKEAIGGLFIDPDEVVWLARSSREEVIAKHATRSVLSYAVATPEGWSAPGEMGFFGMSTDSQGDHLAWSERMIDVLRGLPDDEWLTLVDCHV